MRNNLYHTLTEYAEDLLMVDATIALNELFRHGSINLLSGVKGFQDIDINVEVNSPFVVYEDKITFHFNGTSFDNDGFLRVPEGVESIWINDYDSLQNKTIQVYANTYFLNSLSKTFFTLAQLQVNVVQRDYTLRKYEEIKSNIYKYLPGVWVYFLGQDFTVHLDLDIDSIDFVDSSAEGFSEFYGGITAGVKFLMSGNSNYQLELLFKTKNAKTRMMMDFDDTPEMLRYHN